MASFGIPLDPYTYAKKVAQQVGVSSQASQASLWRNPSWTKWLPGSEFRPQLHMETFWWKKSIAAGRQAGRKDYFFHNHSFHPGISTYFKKQEYEAHVLVASSIDFYNRALWVKPLQGGKVQSRSLPFPAASKRSNPSLASKDTKPKYSWG